MTGAIHWFRKGLRLHDNPSLLEAISKSTRVYPVFILDPHFAKPSIVGVNRYSFLLESLRDLDTSLRALGSRLFVIKGRPEEQLPRLVDEWEIKLLTFETDTEPYAKIRDKSIVDIVESLGDIKISTYCSHTLFDMEAYVGLSRGNIPKSYQSFQKLFASAGTPRLPLEAPLIMPSVSEDDMNNNDFDIPTLVELGYTEVPSSRFAGGESEALARLCVTVLSRPDWVSNFEKPNTSPNSLEPSTTVLSPYLKFGCLSVCKFYHDLANIYSSSTKYTKPPVSLHGQLLWREFFYLSGYTTPNFDKMENNKLCKQIPWGRDRELITVWKEGRTGYPFIDAIMKQLRTEGWIHHLSRHAVACFLTRGDLWQHWEEGARVFDLYLLDADWSLNQANWQWLSCSRYFFQYFRVYSPVAFGKKTDPQGAYIKKWLPQLANMPAKYIFEPWKAPLSVQQQANCIVGVDYPNPIVDHDVISKNNIARMKDAYSTQDGFEDDDVEQKGGSGKKKDASSSSSSSRSTTETGASRTRKRGTTVTSQESILKFAKLKK